MDEIKHKPHDLISSTLDGTWADLWKKAQNPPKHLISKDASPQGTFRCTCGLCFTEVKDWSEHSTMKGED